MSVKTVRSRDNDSQSERRTRILDPAERCFVRSGFHRTTMQDVAAEAGMSQGNVYRYFPSKDAIVAGTTERDRAEVAGDFASFINVLEFPVLVGLGRSERGAEAPPGARLPCCGCCTSPLQI